MKRVIPKFDKKLRNLNKNSMGTSTEQMITDVADHTDTLKFVITGAAMWAQ